LLLSAARAGDIDQQRQALAPSSNGAGEGRSAANAGSVALRAKNEAEHRLVTRATLC